MQPKNSAKAEFFVSVIDLASLSFVLNATRYTSKALSLPVKPLVDVLSLCTKTDQFVRESGF